jgi:hypothetical protein
MADNLTTFMCRLSRNLGASTSWNPQGLSRLIMGLVYLFSRSQSHKNVAKLFKFCLIHYSYMSMWFHMQHNKYPNYNNFFTGATYVAEATILACRSQTFASKCVKHTWTLTYPNKEKYRGVKVEDQRDRDVGLARRHCRFTLMERPLIPTEMSGSNNPSGCPTREDTPKFRSTSCSKVVSGAKKAVGVFVRIRTPGHPVHQTSYALICISAYTSSSWYMGSRRNNIEGHFVIWWTVLFPYRLRNHKESNTCHFEISIPKYVQYVTNYVQNGYVTVQSTPNNG